MPPLKAPARCNKNNFINMRCIRIYTNLEEVNCRFFNLDSFSPEVGLFQCTLPTSEMHTLQGAKNRNWISRYEESLGFEASIKQ